jgi:hypothetical protein
LTTTTNRQTLRLPWIPHHSKLSGKLIPTASFLPKTSNRVVGESALADEIQQTFTHTKQMDWILPGIPPTGRKIEIGIVAVVLFRGDKICGERIYWDHPSVLQQAGLLQSASGRTHRAAQ